MGLRTNSRVVDAACTSVNPDPKPVLVNTEVLTQAITNVAYDNETIGKVRCQMASAVIQDPTSAVFAQTPEDRDKARLAEAEKWTAWVLYGRKF